MIYSFLFFIGDFIAYSLFNDWMLRLLLVRFVLMQLSPARKENMLKSVVFPLFLLLLQDTFLYGRFGLGLVYLIPILLISHWLLTVVAPTVRVTPYIMVSVAILGELIIEKMYLLDQNNDVASTVLIVLLNLMAVFFYRFLIGTRGNRTPSS